MEKNPAILDFIRRVSSIEGVRCVVAEPEEGAIHLTIFATPLSEDLQDRVYAIEDEIIDTYPDLFDFHLRDAARNFGSTPVAIPGECFVWGSLDAEPRRAPQTSKG